MLQLYLARAIANSNCEFIGFWTTCSPDWVNAIAASRTTLKVEGLFLLLVITPTVKKLLKWL
ncbi:MAG: hypothetical protein RMZ41_006545 [Nostoc sp. DedVER02]|uniref:hypothetical protein n=1 Tax=unclassified Nostoc TaxID=2593658 RepID=UPI002AD4C7D1|nr:hypothetical protein [Nostoc sp. DedVER02]MDZ7985920.1 hypothetical protein [Nostoc sp. DedVER02]MDZ8111521.1 hypothetical protein [Nostoc sp. DedVER01b]